MPLEELLFAFTLGMYWTGVYEHVTWTAAIRAPRGAVGARIIKGETMRCRVLRIQAYSHDFIGNLMARRQKATISTEEYLTPEAQKALADRLARAEGHIRSVRQMVIDHRCADEILLQIAAVKAALNQVAAGVIETEMRACVSSCMPGDADDRLGRVAKALATVLKSS